MSIMSDDDFVRLFQRTFGLKEDGWAGNDTVGKLRELARLAGIEEPQVPLSQIPDDYWPMLSKIESNNRPYVQAPTSTASGLYQFIQSTWIGEGGSWGRDAKGRLIARPAFGGLRPSEAEQLARAKTFTAKNADYLKRQGIPINKASLYAAHFFGPGVAAKVIKADVNDSAESLAGPAATAANPSILRGKTVGQFLSWLHGKTGAWAR
ncbi:peptidoglycan-binding protein [Brevundimonas sp. S30B]|uniref:peptidoglycan-binding protein n=1 Tax=unclassified Brevundimonas TaxID=2622653 RepID=UPI0010721F59|nr:MULTISPECIES: peptidoglycan-binding protein [unclassified Brevundimonas]QBX37209.1 peptidoglycan-binding protein [Brevundimonas sp. MF30-B]TFW03997.1 peptidoglycan-binding protein [Brevundimonas sp. S30B]